MAPASVVTVKPLDEGGVDVQVFVPTSDGGTEFTITVERETGGDWRVFIPWEDGDVLGEQSLIIGGYEFTYGECSISAPDDMGMPNA